MPTNRRVLIFDGHNTFLRNFVVNPATDANKGEPIGGLVGTIRSLKFMIHDVKPSRVLFVWDGEGGSRRRRGVMAEYKMGRKPRLNREMDEPTGDSRANLAWQMAKTKSLLSFLGVVQLEVDDIEADDSIAYLCGCLDPAQKVLVSSDHDMWQLISPTTTIYWPPKKTYLSLGNLAEFTPYHPENYVLARALSGKGDRSDNVTGIKGLGDKTILKLFPRLATSPISLEDLFEECRKEVQDGQKPLAGVKRWYSVVLENSDLVSRNVQVMQLAIPNISAQAGSIIRNAANTKPTFNITGFKLALLNHGIQLTDPDIFTVFQEYRVRAMSDAE